MHKIITRSAAVLAATVVIGGGLAMSAPNADASSRHGTATTSEARKVIRKADRERCLTRAETRKIVKGEGTEFAVDGPTRGFQWAGRGEVATLTVTYVHGCADYVGIDYRHARTLQWADWNVGLGSPESMV